MNDAKRDSTQPGVEWRGQRYRSLSVVAREITGAHWSGPLFFGLTSKKEAGDG